jgi:cysteinyl-tRNA synthetase
VDALVTSHYDMLVLEPTRTDWSSDDKYFDAKEMVTRLKNSKASDGQGRKLIIAYIDIGEAEDWRWYWTWSKDWDCQGDPPADWPDYILACDPDGWTGNYPVAYWDPDWKDIIIYSQNQGSHPDRDYNSVIDEVIKDGFDGIYLDWVEGFENEAVIAAAQAAGKDPASEMIAFIQDMRTTRRPATPTSSSSSKTRPL